MQVILVFILLGQLLAITGGSAFFTDLATTAVGRFRGGAGKIAVFGSMLFGTISGSAVANVVGTGIVTIPLMKRSGFPAAMAGGIEAVASTGGQLMPPIVGAAVFLMAEFIEAPYGDVMLAALLPILLYYVALFFQVDLAAAKYGLVAVPRARIPPAGPTLRSGWHFILPFVVFLAGIFSYGMQPENAAIWALGTLLVSALALGYKGRRARPSELLGALTDAGRSAVEIILVTAGAGIVIGVLNLSGFAYALSVILINFAGGSLVVLLLLAAAVSIVLGMGMPTVGVYVLLATLVAPALEQLGVAKLAAHLFVLYFGMMSMITPPVALAAYAAANLAGADPWRTGLYAVRLGWTAYIVPFLFVASPALLLIGAPAAHRLDRAHRGGRDLAGHRRLRRLRAAPARRPDARCVRRDRACAVHPAVRLPRRAAARGDRRHRRPRARRLALARSPARKQCRDRFGRGGRATLMAQPYARIRCPRA